MTVSSPYDMTSKDKNKIYNNFKPYMLEIKNINNLSYYVSSNSDINITAKIGDIVKVVVDNDSVKKLLIDILLQKSDEVNYEYSLIDECGNRLIGESIRYYINYVPNNLSIKNGSFISNITNGKENIKIRKINEICTLVGLYDYANILPQGLDTEINNDVNITNAIKYKIVMARELIIDRPIIIFDEPDLFLNGKTKNVLNSTIKFMIKDHIVLVFTKLNKQLNLNEKTIEICSYDKAKINEDIIFNL